jgi:Flp pilus assembly protein CpaB
MTPKKLLLLSVAAGLLAVLLVQFQMRKAKGNPVSVFRATATVEPGEAIGSRLERVTLPGENLFPNILKEAPTADMAEFVSTTPVRQPLQPGEIVLYRHLEGTVDPGIRKRIPAGMKAVSLTVDEASSVSYLVEPEDVVDVLAALPMRLDLDPLRPGTEGVQDPGNAPLLETRPLLQGVKVLATGRRYQRSAEPSGRREPYSTVTLLLTMEEAQKLAYARDVLDSPMTLVLRSPAETGKQAPARAVSLLSGNFDQIGQRPPR